MKKNFIIIIILLLILTPVLAQESNMHYLDTLTLKQTISNQVNITPTDNNYNVNYMELWLYLFAQNDFMQTVTSQTTTAKYTVQNDKMLFRWDDVTQNSVSFNLSQIIKVDSDPIKINSKVSFPVKNVPLDIVKYTQFTDHIDSSPKIESLSNSLAQGEDDLFVLENKIASWVSDNIEYNLSTITSEANIPSSIVLDEGYGVCDEITNLFISINRELGVPARFVSGIAYSESALFNKKWGNHGWAEVYFPDIGWVPYDVTYKQFARIDATHISLQKGVDGNAPSIQYKSSGYNFDFSQGSLNMDTKIVSKGSKRKPDVHINISFFANSVSFGSYNLVTAKITNLHPYYLSEKITLVPTTNTKILSKADKQFSLKPHETKTLSWIIEVSPNLDSGYYYTFPVAVVDNLNYRSEKSFRVDQKSPFIKYEDLSSFAVKKDSKQLSFFCSGNKENILNKTSTINCDLKNIDPLEFPVKFCLLNDCQIAKSKLDTISFNVQSKKLGVETLKIVASGKNLSGSSYFTIRTLDLERLAIKNIEFPKELASYKNYSLSFKIVKTSIASPKNITVSVKHALFSEDWKQDALVGDQAFTLSMPGNLFTFGNNKIVISYSFIDSDGKLITGKKLVTTKLSDIKGADYLIVGLNTLDEKVDKILKKEHDKTTTTISVISFAIILSLFLTIIQKILRFILKK